LVIGNSAYGTGPLKNPVNDATDIATTLEKLGFKVTLKKNANLETMEEAIEDFGNNLKRGGVGLFYFAGHGVQVNGVNYLIPIGAKINKESDVKYRSVDANKILDEMANANNGLNIVVLDACRDNPYARRFRNATRGLAIVSSAPSGTFISYSTSPGQVARDGEGRNSPYTDALMQYMKKPGLTIEDVFKGVRQKLRKEIGQVPWELSSLEGKFFFVPGETSKKVEVVTEEAATPTKALDHEQRKIDEEKEKLRKEKELLAKEKGELEEKKKQLEIAKEPSTQVYSKPAISPEQQITEVPLIKRFPIPESSESIIIKEKEYMGVVKVVPSPVVSVNEIRRDGRFIAYDNGTVLDTSTNLMWAAKDNGYNINWQNAKSYCENYRGGGYTDWRMPTQDELAGLYDENKSRPVACYPKYNIHVATELIDMTCFAPWASETRGIGAADFGFDSGGRAMIHKETTSDARALPVRSVK
jgi:uncharacterized caspase-like protein